MTNMILVDGGVTKLLDVKISKTLTTSEFVESLGVNKDTFLIPRDVIQIQHGDDYVKVMVEKPAKLIRVVSSSDSGSSTYRIGIPYTQFYFKFNKSGGMRCNRVTVTKKPIKNMEDQVFAPPYQNIHSSGMGHICFGAVSVAVETPFVDKAQYLADQFFASPFNADLSASEFWVDGTHHQSSRESIRIMAECTNKNKLFALADDTVYPLIGSYENLVESF